MILSQAPAQTGIGPYSYEFQITKGMILIKTPREFRNFYAYNFYAYIFATWTSPVNTAERQLQLCKI
jgi:hypothetical protein